MMPEPSPCAPGPDTSISTILGRTCFATAAAWLSGTGPVADPGGAVTTFTLPPADVPPSAWYIAYEPIPAPSIAAMSHARAARQMLRWPSSRFHRRAGRPNAGCSKMLVTEGTSVVVAFSNHGEGGGV